MTNMRET